MRLHLISMHICGLQSCMTSTDDIVPFHLNLPHTTNVRFHLTSLHLHLFLNTGARWDTTDDFMTSFLHFSLSSTAVWDLVNSRPVHSLTYSSHLFLCLVFFSLLPCLAKWCWPGLLNGRHLHTTLGNLNYGNNNCSISSYLML